MIKILFMILLIAGIASASTALDNSKIENSLISNSEKLGKVGNRLEADGHVKFKHFREFYKNGAVKINFYDMEFDAAWANEISGFINK